MLWSHKLYLADYLQHLTTTARLSIATSHTECVLLWRNNCLHTDVHNLGYIKWIKVDNY